VGRPGLATPLFFGKYAILAVLAFYFVGNKEKVSRVSAPYMGIVLFYLFYCLMELFNMDVTENPVVGAVGLAVHLGFLPLAILLPRIITRMEHIDKIFNVMVWVCLPIFILGVVQYASPPDAFINKYVSDELGVATVGEHARITTVFSYLSGHVSLLSIVMPLFFILVTTGFKSSQGKALVIGVFLLGLLNLLMTGSRARSGSSSSTWCSFRWAWAWACRQQAQQEPVYGTTGGHWLAGHRGAHPHRVRPRIP
jgi:hypothetical protein